MTKVVLDTNVLINAFKDEYSYEKRIIDEVSNSRLEAYANKQTLQENKLMLQQLLDSPDYDRELNNFFGQINTVANRRKISIVDDPEDNKILESAVEARADYLISSDNALLKLEKYDEVAIVNPTQFWTYYKDDQKDNLWTQWTKFITTGKP